MSKLVLLVTREGLGQVDPTDRPFGLEMFDRFLHALESQAVKPHAICFYTAGVKLVCNGSPGLLGLRILHGQGVRLVACRTCLEHFGLSDKVAVGEVGGMNDIVGLLTEADSVVTV
ncbi:MAG TPA: DsrE family protein [Terriglobia bacterium]|nr:DsrE family protein [Terriglobia bacterium]